MLSYNKTGKAVSLKDKPLASGGEGAVYEILGHNDIVAKIYHSVSSARAREQKLNAMFRFTRANPVLCKKIALPIEGLFNKKRELIGYVMPKITASDELCDLYVFPPRPTAPDMNKKLDVLVSLSDTVILLHSCHQTIGDSNPTNMKIDSSGNVYFLDADSLNFFQSSDGHLFRCTVCAPGYVAPEVIRACENEHTDYEHCSVPFSEETDRFALAVHICRMLFNGAHPFSGQKILKPTQSSVPAPKPIDKRVRNGETVFFKSIPYQSPPLYAPDVRSFPKYMIDLFVRAFVDGDSDPSKRPSAVEWKQALLRYRSELVACSNDPKHYYWKGATKCPYCEAENRFKSKSKKVVATANKPIIPAPVKTAAAAAGSFVPAFNNAAAAAAGKSPRGILFTVFYWIVSLFCGVGLSVPLAQILYQEVYLPIYTSDFEVLAAISTYGGIISSFAGVIFFNLKLSRVGKEISEHKWWEYALSLLLSVTFAALFTAGFGLAFGLLLVALIIALLILIFMIVVSILTS